MGAPALFLRRLVGQVVPELGQIGQIVGPLRQEKLLVEIVEHLLPAGIELPLAQHLVHLGGVPFQVRVDQHFVVFCFGELPVGLPPMGSAERSTSTWPAATRN